VSNNNMVRVTVSMPATLRDRLDVAALRNRNVEPGFGDCRNDLIVSACEDWLNGADNPFIAAVDSVRATPAELRAVRRKRRSVRIDSACSHSKRGGGG
jgi:hypothetical protein